MFVLNGDGRSNRDIALTSDGGIYKVYGMKSDESLLKFMRTMLNKRYQLSFFTEVEFDDGTDSIELSAANYSASLFVRPVWEFLYEHNVQKEKIKSAYKGLCPAIFILKDGTIRTCPAVLVVQKLNLTVDQASSVRNISGRYELNE